MSDGLNKVMLIGNLGRDPELRYTANGSAVSNFTMAVTRTYGSGEQRREETEWFTVVAWEQLAEVISQRLEKGRRVFVEGRMATRSWDGPDGQKRYRTEVVANKVIFLDSGKGGHNPSTWPDVADALQPDIDPDDMPFEVE